MEHALRQRLGRGDQHEQTGNEAHANNAPPML